MTYLYFAIVPVVFVPIVLFNLYLKKSYKLQIPHIIHKALYNEDINKVEALQKCIPEWNPDQSIIEDIISGGKLKSFMWIESRFEILNPRYLVTAVSYSQLEILKVLSLRIDLTSYINFLTKLSYVKGDLRIFRWLFPLQKRSLREFIQEYGIYNGETDEQKFNFMRFIVKQFQNHAQDQLLMTYFFKIISESKHAESVLFISRMIEQ